MKNLVKTAVITALFISQTVSPNYFGAYWDSMKASLDRNEQYIRIDTQNKKAKTDADIALAKHNAEALMIKHPTSSLSTSESLQRDWKYFQYCKHNTWTPEERMRHYANQISTIPASYLVYNIIRCPYTAGPQYGAIAAGVITFAQLQAFLHSN